MVLLFSALPACGSGETRPDEPLPSRAGAEAEQSVLSVALLDHDTLRAWKPNDAVNGLGAEILLRQDIDEISEDQLLSFIRRLAGDHDPVLIRVYTSQEAYAAEREQTYGPAYDEGYILFYIKNLTGRGAYGGRNEVRWMQESGRFAARFGEATPLPR